MKKLSILFCTIVLVQFAKAQITISLSMNPKPVANISSWSSRRDVLTLVATSQNDAVNVKINATIKTADGTIVATTDMQRAPIKTLVQNGNTIFYAADVVDLSAIVFSGNFQKKIKATGKLPSGTYQIIVRLDSPDGPVELSNTRTATFILASMQLPILIAPADASVLNEGVAKTAITFRWTPLIPRPTETVTYRVQVFEIVAGQNALQALRGNQPLLDKAVTNATQYIWQPQLGFADSIPKKFVWTIQTFDALDQIITGETPNGEGRSEPKTFIVSRTIKNKE